MYSLPENVKVSKPLVLSAISPRPTKSIELSLYADMSAVKVTSAVLLQGEDKKSASKRGRITRFTRKSRKRFIEGLVKKRNYTRPLFLTLTIPDEAWFDLSFTNERFQATLEAFLERLRKNYPGHDYAWRKEWEDRKSGSHKGETVPHIHMILDNLLYDINDLRKEFRKWWMEILTDGKPELLVKGCRIDLQVAKSRRHAMYYVSKYVAKETDVTTWLEDETCRPVDSIGRQWGMSASWDTSESITVKLTHAQYVQWRRLVSRWLKSKGSHYAKKLAQSNVRFGCSVFGLGDMSHKSYETLYDSAAFRLLMHVLELA